MILAIQAALGVTVSAQPETASGAREYRLA